MIIVPILLQLPQIPREGDMLAGRVNDEMHVCGHKTDMGEALIGRSVVGFRQDTF